MILSHKMDDQVIQTPYLGQLNEKYDVIVVGLGTAGAISAIVAAEKGLKVLAIEKMNCMGGAGTAGGVLIYYFGQKGGKFEDVDKKVAELAKLNNYTPSDGVNGELKKYVLEQMAVEAGVEIRYESSITGVLLDGNKVCGIEYFNEDGFGYAESHVVIDSTGDAYVCAIAGCTLSEGRELDGKAQPYSNVLQVLRDGRVRVAYTDSGYVNPSSAEDISRAIIQSALVSTHLKETYDDKARILRVAPQLGLREGRFIVSEEDVSFAHYINEQVTDKPVFYAYANLDTHSKDIALESDAVQEWLVASGLWSLNFNVPIPLGSHIPKGYEGILVAGRCIGVDHDIASQVRMKRDMQKSGEVAANAAYLSIKHGVSIQEVDYDELVNLLQETQCYEVAPQLQWLDDPVEIKTALASEKPGVAIWSVRRLGEQLHKELIAWTEEKGNEPLRKHAAIALALSGNRLALPILRDIVRERDSYVPKTSHLYSQARSFAAIYLMGKLSDVEMISELIEIVEEPTKFNYISDDKSLVYDDQDVTFQYFSYAWRSLITIGEACPAHRDVIGEALIGIMNRSDLLLQLSLHGESGIRFNMVEAIRDITQKYLESWKKI
jgi:pyrimidine deaminase RibD-like protein